MFIIIDMDGRRIKITGEFQVYGQGADLLSIAEQIKRQVKKNKIDYGWITLMEGFTLSTETPKEAPPSDPAPEKPYIEWTKEVSVLPIAIVPK